MPSIFKPIILILSSIATLAYSSCEMATWINEARATQNLSPLKYDSRLATVALENAQCEERIGALDHDCNGPMGERVFGGMSGTTLTMAAENTAMHPAGLRAAFDALMDSPSHYANIMNPSLTHVGIGVSGYYVTQSFAGVRGSSPSEVSGCGSNSGSNGQQQQNVPTTTTIIQSVPTLVSRKTPSQKTTVRKKDKSQTNSKTNSKDCSSGSTRTQTLRTYELPSGTVVTVTPSLPGLSNGTAITYNSNGRPQLKFNPRRVNWICVSSSV